MTIREATGLAAALLAIAFASAPARASAVYPRISGQPVWLQQQVAPSDGTEFYDFGSSITVCGSTAFIGAEFTSNPDSSGGAVYVFGQSGGAWVEQQQITPSDGARDFGASVACDGTTLAIGSTPNSYSGGAVYVYRDSGGAWTRIKKLTVSGANEYSGFGAEVAVSGNTILAGAPGVNLDAGAVYVFTKANGNWSETQEIQGGAPNGLFGYSLALSGTTALIGQPGNLVDPPVQGSAHLFRKSNGSWLSVQTLSADDGGPGDRFGRSVAIDRETALVGAALDYQNEPGAAYVYTVSGGYWSLEQELHAGNGIAGDDFGAAIALYGATAVIGAPFAPVVDDTEQGTLYIFDRSGGTWTQTQALEVLESGGTGNFGFGESLAVGDSGVLAGDFDAGFGAGTVYFYGESDLDLTVSAPAYVKPGDTYVSQTIATNDAASMSPAIPVTLTVPAAASFISAQPSQGSCDRSDSVLTCALGSLNGNAGSATIDVTLKATGDSGTTIENDAALARSQPPLAAAAATRIDNPPAASDGSLTVDENTSGSGILEASDPDGDSLTFAVIGKPDHGNVTINDAATGAYTYTPNQNYDGSDSFTFTANDGYADSNSAKVSITVKSSGGSGGGSGGGGGGGSLGWPILLALLGLALAGAVANRDRQRRMRAARITRPRRMDNTASSAIGMDI